MGIAPISSPWRTRRQVGSLANEAHSMNTHTLSRLSRLAITAFALVAIAPAQGRIIAIGDEWLLSDIAFTSQPVQTTQLAHNIANYFGNGQPGNFLVLSSVPDIPGFGARGVQGAPLAAVMTTAGHSWTINASAPLTLATLNQYDGVFLAGTVASGAANAGTLASYVNGGGSVLVMAGVGTGFLGAASEAAAWNPFLNQFGLGFGSTYFAFGTNLLPIPVAPSGHALSQGLSIVSWGNGHVTLDLDASNPQNQVAVRGSFAPFGGGPQGDVNDIIATFNLGTVAAIYVPFGSGCAGSVGMATNTASALPQIGQTMVANIGNLPPPNLAFFVFGWSRTTSMFGPLPIDLGVVGAPGCLLRVSNDFVGAIVGSGGSASFSLGIPGSQSFLGLQFFTQALALDPGWNALGAVLSDAAEATIGN
jgi:hypothetical protein